MKKHHITILIMILLISCSRAQNVSNEEGIYQGVFTYGNFTDNISFEIRKDSANWQVNFSSLEQNAFQIPVRNIEVIGDSLHFILQSDKYTYDFANIWNHNESMLSGTLKVDTVMVDYTLEKQVLSDENIVEPKEINFQFGGIKFGGTIWKPKRPNKKAIVFITSSGGGDRSGSRAEAIHFANKGFTTFHFDKRGTGVSDGNWQSANIAELCADDINAIKYFSNHTGIPLSQIGIKGSSQGGAKVPYILDKLKELSYGIVVSCPGSTLLESDLNYWKNRNRPALGNHLENAAQLQKKVFGHIAGIVTRTELEKSIKAQKSKTWFSSVWIPNLNELQTDKKLSYTPIPYFEKTKQPILVIQGTTDEIIPNKSHEIITQALKKAQNHNHKVVLLKEANHSMYNTGKSDFPYWAKLHAEYLKTLETWISSNFDKLD